MQLAVSDETAKVFKEDWMETMKFNWQSFRDYDLHRQFEKYSKLDAAALPPEKFRKLNKVISDMQAIYATTKVCDYRDKTKCNLELEPGEVQKTPVL